MDNVNTRYEYYKADVSIPSGQTTTQVRTFIKDGVVRGVAFHKFSSATPTHAVNIGIQSSQASDLIQQHDYRDYAKGDQGGIDAYKPANFESGRELQVNVNASQALAADFSGQLVFVVEVNR